MIAAPRLRGCWRRARARPLLMVVAIGAVALTLTLLVVRLVPRATLSDAVPLSTAVTAADGTMLRLTRAADGQYRLWTPLRNIAPALAEVTLLYEDRHFFHHPGINPLSLGRAAFATYLGGGRRIGGSTITMQLARRLWGLSSRSVSGKVVQMLRALELEACYSKREILEAYLNLVPYGGNVEGVGAATQLYFRKSPAKLTVAEALTLAVIPQSPSRRMPGGAGDGGAASASLERARASLLALWTARAPHRSGDDSDGRLATTEPPVRSWPVLAPPSPQALPFAAPHFVDQVLAEQAATGNTPPQGAELTTTLDISLQRLLERHLRAYVARESRRGLRNAAALLVDARTVAVRALVGSANFFDAGIAGQVNGTLAKRSPGSALKPFAYALGMDQGVIHPATMLRDVPTAFAAYSPENFDGRFVGPLSAKDALIRSRNVPALAVAARLTRPSLYDFLKTAAVDLPLPESNYGLGVVLGTAEVTMQDLARLYAALANGGVMAPLVWRASDEEPRRHLFASPKAAPSIAGAAAQPSTGGESERVRVLSEESAFLVLNMLADNPRPASRPARAPEARAVTVAWKTGTSWGFRDAWAVGVFGPYVLAVWVGDFSGAGNVAFVGAQAAGPLFFEIVDSMAARHPEIADTAQPADVAGLRREIPRGVRRVEVCALSGGLPTPDCPHRRMSWFIPGRSPIDRCAIHRTLLLDAHGQRTCAAGPPAVRGEPFEVWPSDLAKLFATAGLPRRSLPPAAPGCGDVDAPRGEPPRITSPLAGVTYTVRGSGASAHGGPVAARPEGLDGDVLALQAVTDGDAADLFWFADQVFVGKARRGSTFFWRPPGAGKYTLRAVDDLGRADARAVAVEVLR